MLWALFRINNIDGILRTYLFLFKNHFQFEQYLTIKIFDKRRCLTTFRISSHRLKIETGRFSKSLSPLENRVCDHYQSVIEDEFHFMIQCPKYTHICKFFIQMFRNIVKNFLSLDDKLKFNWLLSKLC